MISVKIVIGNPTLASRTRGVAERFVAALLVDGSYDLEVIELGDYSSELFDFASERAGALNKSVAAADLVVFATPTYKATYTGLLKAFLDRYGTNGLAGVVAIPVQTGGNMGHSMSPTHTLAPLLLELGATLPGRGFYMPMDREGELDALVEAAAAEHAQNLRKLAVLADVTVPLPR